MATEDDHLQRLKARVGTTIRDKWHLDRLLGVGGMAAVYVATHRNNKRVALKMLHPELSDSAELRARFLREGYAANTVNHPGAVSIDDDDVTEDGAAFIVMELLDGETLDERQQRKGGRLPPQEVLSLADQLLDVLAAAHPKGIIHRDLKPENLFLRRDGVLKVLDFGIARVRELGHSTQATCLGSIIGTPAYMAPEQARGLTDEIDGRTDLWSVGATMFKLLTGRMVHEATTVNEILARSILQHAPPIASLMPSLEPRIADLVDRALAFDKRERFDDARQMQDAVRQALAALIADARTPAPSGAATPLLSAPPPAQPTTSRPLSAPARSAAFRPSRFALLAAAGLSVASAGALLLRAATRQPPAIPSPSRDVPSAPLAHAAASQSPPTLAETDAGLDAPVASISTHELPATGDGKRGSPVVTSTVAASARPPASTTAAPATTPARTAAPADSGSDPFSRRR